jgi:hypothetical protein
MSYSGRGFLCSPSLYVRAGDGGGGEGLLNIVSKDIIRYIEISSTLITNDLGNGRSHTPSEAFYRLGTL